MFNRLLNKLGFDLEDLLWMVLLSAPVIATVVIIFL